LQLDNESIEINSFTIYVARLIGHYGRRAEHFIELVNNSIDEIKRGVRITPLMLDFLKSGARSLRQDVSQLLRLRKICTMYTKQIDKLVDCLSKFANQIMTFVAENGNLMIVFEPLVIQHQLRTYHVKQG